jgi:hypothetical protein
MTLCIERGGSTVKHFFDTCLVADVGEESEVEVVLIVEALLLGNVIAADPQDDAIQLVELSWYM